MDDDIKDICKAIRNLTENKYPEDKELALRYCMSKLDPDNPNPEMAIIMYMREWVFMAREESERKRKQLELLTNYREFACIAYDQAVKEFDL